MIAIRPRAHYVLSFDHRLVNGSDADLFMKTFKELEGVDGNAVARFMARPIELRRLRAKT